jgi:hypothetical protein
MRRLRPFPVEDLLLAQVIPGFLFTVAWTVLYEIYHEDGSYYTTLIQEILGSEGLFPYFLISAVLMAFPVGMLVDSLRHVVGEVWLGRAPASPLQWIEQLGALSGDFEKRYVLYRHAWAALLAPAKAAGNLALVLLTLTVWSVIKILRMGGWRVFSPAFVVGTPLVGLGLVLVLSIRYASGMAEFHRRVQESIFPSKEAALSGPTGEVPIASSCPSPTLNDPATGK